MSDLIKREDALLECEALTPIDCKMMKKRISDIPSAEPKQGEWVATDNTDEWYGPVYKCSICGSEVICDCDNYCPNCGARMKGERVDEMLQMPTISLLEQRK